MMTTTVAQSSLAEQRDYLQALQNGTLPECRPIFDDRLDEVIRLIEQIVTESRGNKRAIHNVIAALSRTNTTLAQLAAGETAKEDTQPLQVEGDTSATPPLPQGIATLLEQDVSDVCPEKDIYVRYSMQVSPEGYEEFHDTCWYFTLSTVAARRIKINLRTPLDTHFYSILAARSSMYKKTVTAGVARKVLKQAGLDWMLGLTRMTPQKLLLDMSGPLPENYKDLSPDLRELLKMQLAMAGQRGWIYNEFGKLIKAMHRASGPMADYIEILLQLADRNEDLPGGTIGRGTERIEKPYLCLLGTLTPASIKAVAGSGAEIWNDGFLARFVFSCPPPDTYIDSPFEIGEIGVPSSLTTSLRRWHERLGVPVIDIEPILTEDERETGRYTKTWIQPLPEVSYTPTRDAYNCWTMYRSALKAMARSFGKEDFDASYERLPEMALRVAALVASLADEGNEHKIEVPHLIVGLQQAEKWRTSLHRLYAQVNADIASGMPTLEDRVLDKIALLQNERGVSARDIARALHRESKEIETIVSALVRSDVVVKEPARQGYKYRIAGSSQ